MNYRCSSELSKEEVLSRASGSVTYDSRFSLPKSIDGRVYGPRIQLIRRGGLFYVPGRGRFDGVVQEIEGKTYVVGRFNEPWLATGAGLFLGGVLLIGIIAQGNGSLGALLVTGLVSMSGYAMVRYDVSCIKGAIEQIAGRK